MSHKEVPEISHLFWSSETQMRFACIEFTWDLCYWIETRFLSFGSGSVKRAPHRFWSMKVCRMSTVGDRQTIAGQTLVHWISICVMKRIIVFCEVWIKWSIGHEYGVWLLSRGSRRRVLIAVEVLESSVSCLTRFLHYCYLSGSHLLLGTQPLRWKAKKCREIRLKSMKRWQTSAQQLVVRDMTHMKWKVAVRSWGSGQDLSRNGRSKNTAVRQMENSLSETSVISHSLRYRQLFRTKDITQKWKQFKLFKRLKIWVKFSEISANCFNNRLESVFTNFSPTNKLWEIESNKSNRLTKKMKCASIAMSSSTAFIIFSLIHFGTTNVDIRITTGADINLYTQKHTLNQWFMC